MTFLRSWLLLLLVLLFPLTGMAGVAHLSAPAAQVQPCPDTAQGRAQQQDHGHGHAHAAPAAGVQESACCLEDPAAPGCLSSAGEACQDCAQCPGVGGNAFTADTPALPAPPIYGSRGHWPAQAGMAYSLPERLERPPRAG